jgi:glycosyltransferase involved in cell wall biosynthesis
MLVGDGPLHDQVVAALKNENIFDRTILTGLRRDVPRMMAAMDIFMLSSLWEGLPRVIPQAMAMGLPVIANRADGTIEAIQNGRTGYLCTPGQPEEIAKRCIQLIEQPELRKRMGQRGRVAARESFDLHQMIHQIEDLYQTIIDRHGHIQ